MLVQSFVTCTENSVAQLCEGAYVPGLVGSGKGVVCDLTQNPVASYGVFVWGIHLERPMLPEERWDPNVGRALHAHVPLHALACTYCPVISQQYFCICLGLGGPVGFLLVVGPGSLLILAAHAVLYMAVTYD